MTIGDLVELCVPEVRIVRYMYDTHEALVIPTNTTESSIANSITMFSRLRISANLLDYSYEHLYSEKDTYINNQLHVKILRPDAGVYSIFKVISQNPRKLEYIEDEIISKLHSYLTDVQHNKKFNLSSTKGLIYSQCPENLDVFIVQNFAGLLYRINKSYLKKI